MANPTMSLIASNTVGVGGVASVTFSSIPTAYTDLKLIVSVRVSNSDYYDNAQIYVNGNSTGSNYSIVRLYNLSTSINSDSSTSAYYSGGFVGNTAAANIFSNTEYYFANYANSTTYKSLSTNSTTESSTSNIFQLIGSWLYKQNTAISSITINSLAGNTLQQYSTFYLYGIKNS